MHPYFAFDGGSGLSPIDTGTGPGAGGTWPQAACDRWASSMNARFDCSLRSVCFDQLIIPPVASHSGLQLLENLATVSTIVVFSLEESEHQRCMVGTAPTGKMLLGGLLVRKLVC